ncbi:MAG: hypothetical protein AVDCRST_MAG19-4940, partial [uncultured Thermomicrobiales bacterium]
ERTVGRFDALGAHGGQAVAGVGGLRRCMGVRVLAPELLLCRRGNGRRGDVAGRNRRAGAGTRPGLGRHHVGHRGGEGASWAARAGPLPAVGRSGPRPAAARHRLGRGRVPGAVWRGEPRPARPDGRRRRRHPNRVGRNGGALAPLALGPVVDPRRAPLRCGGPRVPARAM